MRNTAVALNGIHHIDAAPDLTPPAQLHVEGTVAGNTEALLGRYFDMLASEDDDAIDNQAALRQEIAAELAAASKRPQTSTIQSLCERITATNLAETEQLQELRLALARELAKSDNLLWNEIEGEDDLLFAKLTAGMDSVYG